MSDINYSEAVAKALEEARKAPLPSCEIVKAIDLKVGDTIIHKYSKFKITECGCGYGAGNEFGHYFWIKGYSVSSKIVDDFWSFQKCPVIKIYE
jgi:hypothetical protein